MNCDHLIIPQLNTTSVGNSQLVGQTDVSTVLTCTFFFDPWDPPLSPPLWLLHHDPWGLGAVPPGGHLGGAVPRSYVVVVPGEVLRVVPLHLHDASEGQSESASAGIELGSLDS